jgi:hypothetical protein
MEDGLEGFRTRGIPGIGVQRNVFERDRLISWERDKGLLSVHFKYKVDRLPSAQVGKEEEENIVRQIVLGRSREGKTGFRIGLAEIDGERAVTRSLDPKLNHRKVCGPGPIYP